MHYFQECLNHHFPLWSQLRMRVNGYQIPPGSIIAQEYNMYRVNGYQIPAQRKVNNCPSRRPSRLKILSVYRMGTRARSKSLDRKQTTKSVTLLFNHNDSAPSPQASSSKFHFQNWEKRALTTISVTGYRTFNLLQFLAGQYFVIWTFYSKLRGKLMFLSNIAEIEE